MSPRINFMSCEASKEHSVRRRHIVIRKTCRRRLEADSSRVECDTFSDESKRLGTLCSAVVMTVVVSVR